jgi:two-component system, sensor histidine kinase and response regulator
VSTNTLGRLLIVDDERAQMEALCNTLGTEGYTTTGYSSAKQALAALSVGQFDLLLSDLMMPEMDGIALLNASREIDGNLIGIIMTGHGTIDTAVKAMQCGALDYVVKPFRLNVILSVIARALEVRSLRLENAALLERERGYVLELEAANKQLEAFSCSVSHDLRAPLHTISGFCDLYMTEFADGIPEEGRRLLTQVVEGATRMDQLIEDLLRFCRTGRQPVSKCPVQLDRIAQRVAAQLQVSAPGRAVELRIAEIPECAADPSLIEQVFVNLLSNAFKFTRDRDPAVIEVGCFEQAGERIVFVRDNGAGFDMKYAEKLFGVFQRLHSASEFEGTGVGLSIVQLIISRHEGRIWAESKPGEGAAFFFTLAPAAHPEASPQAPSLRAAGGDA